MFVDNQECCHKFWKKGFLEAAFQVYPRKKRDKKRHEHFEVRVNINTRHQSESGNFSTLQVGEEMKKSRNSNTKMIRKLHKILNYLIFSGFFFQKNPGFGQKQCFLKQTIILDAACGKSGEFWQNKSLSAWIFALWCKERISIKRSPNVELMISSHLPKISRKK